VDTCYGRYCNISWTLLISLIWLWELVVGEMVYWVSEIASVLFFWVIYLCCFHSI
jgi:hypothetical protein